MTFPEPSISPRACDGDSSGPVCRKLRLVDRLPGHVIGYIHFDEPMVGKCRGFTDLTVHENLEYCGRRIRRTVEDFLPPRVPSSGRKQTPSPIERVVLREAPDNHLTRTYRVRCRPGVPRRRVRPTPSRVPA